MNKREKEVIDFLVEKLEGGYYKIHNDPNDIGGATRAGIASKYHPEFDLENATKDDIREFYYKKFYSRIDVKSEKLKEYIFLTGVNTGINDIVKIVQRSLNLLSPGEGKIIDDGIWGPNTNKRFKEVIVKMESMSPILFEVFFWDKIKDETMKYYSSRKTAKYHFLGWFNRITKTIMFLAMTGESFNKYMKSEVEK